MLLVGAGAVGESICRILKKRDEKGKWLEYVLVADYNEARAIEVVEHLDHDPRFQAIFINARDMELMKSIIKEHTIDFVMDATDPYLANTIFNAAYEAGVNYANMGTWSVPMDDPAFGLGIENSYAEPMTKYNFDRHEAWKQKGIMACICLGIDPGVVNVFARYAKDHLFDVLEETHVKDGGNLCVPGANPDDIQFGFNVWTVLDEVLNPNVEYDEEKGGFLVEDAFAGEETFIMPEGIGENHLVKVEHEETVTMPKFLGVKKATFKIALDDNLMNALKVINKLGLRSIKPVHVGNVDVIPRDVVATCAPQPKDIKDEMVGAMCVGVHCKGIKDGKHKEVFLYQIFDNQQSMKDWHMQAVVAQTGFGAALAIECIGKGYWKEAGVYSPEYFNPDIYMNLMNASGFTYGMVDITPQGI
ncbi:MAG: saccharopine dehydrogenase NADP-binding domain-containing protein [Holdemanella sp.]|nr:saccharopine dehydrogenase NADP-binding domain-containing protein [Holdemanella sp.]